MTANWPAKIIDLLESTPGVKLLPQQVIGETEYTRQMPNGLHRYTVRWFGLEHENVDFVKHTYPDGKYREYHPVYTQDGVRW